mmetsp:Transcript_78426/g.123568  ORF Transcript_78426/g.123568 Transcript_78426/m.123568 type:complete len:544 (-) Transcript_78426:131-1762(-)|eukprot:CAMPEP_0169235248 /NCGR_PEP_ID=MMETSP1016-20121227/28613_1 /TAXON_ID=342587 /ORGANISM="Karlodinium micrum, Strain CCMP2283" /LENGTH=543 /DNA_ID=CAMNT_0009314775 /DNA_START=48 /DNA_END=1679 /DNA_ORIENTATION=-
MRTFLHISLLASLSHARRVHNSFQQPLSSAEKALSSTLLVAQPSLANRASSNVHLKATSKPLVSPGVPLWKFPHAPRRSRFYMQETDVTEKEEEAEAVKKEDGKETDWEAELLCKIDNLDQCSQEELEIMYVDVLWAFYDEKKQILTDEQYNSLVAELNWAGSGFPSLRRNEIKFVKAAIAFAKGEPMVSDREWTTMKAEVRESTGKTREVTEFLLYTRSLRETAATRARLFEEMGGSGIGVKVTPAGVSCTLSDVPSDLQSDVKAVVKMYAALSLVPAAICSVAWTVVALMTGGPGGFFSLPSLALGGVSVGGGAFALTNQLIKYVELAEPELLTGQCCCCEAPIQYMKSSYSQENAKITCGKCQSDLLIDVAERRVSQPFGLNVIGGKDATPPGESRWIDDVLTKAATASVKRIGGKGFEQTKLGSPEKGKKVVVEPGTTALKYSIDNLKEGIFAWAILIGYSLFGEQFIQRVRGKGIQLHSQAIGAFCQEFALPAKLKQTYIQTAKRNGEDLGFLVPGNNLFGDGLFGKEALEWWKAQGF